MEDVLKSEKQFQDETNKEDNLPLHLTHQLANQLKLKEQGEEKSECFIKILRNFKMYEVNKYKNEELKLN